MMKNKNKNQYYQIEWMEMKYTHTGKMKSLLIFIICMFSILHLLPPNIKSNNKNNSNQSIQ